MSITTDTLAKKLDTIARKAPALRAAGVTRVEVDGVAFEIDPPMPEVDNDPQRNERMRGDLDALDDPDTFGGAVPTMRRRHDS